MTPRSWLSVLGLSTLAIAGAFVGSALTQTEKGKRYALLVGVKKYDHSRLSDLQYTENDAEALAAVLNDAKYDEIVVLTSTRGGKDAKLKPTKANIERELKRLLGKVTKNDLVLLGLSGHGVQYEVKLKDKKRYESFFCPSDARIITSDDFDKLRESMISFRNLFAQLDDSGAGARLLLVDACRNEAGTSRNADTNSMPNPTRGTAALFACKGGERAWENATLKHGIFFYHVIDGLRGKATNKRGEVTWDRLTAHVRSEVPDTVASLIGGGAKQTPHLLANVEGDPVLLTPTAPKGPLDVKGQNSIGMTFVQLVKGKPVEFMRGASKDDADADDNEKPRHKVKLTKDFFMQTTEVTQQQFEKMMGYNPSYFSKAGKGDGTKYEYTQPAGGKEKVESVADADLAAFPVENVSYTEAVAFCKKLNEREKDRLDGWQYRLPTDAQWEYACRAGELAYTKFSLGDALTITGANFNEQVGSTTKVGTYKANKFGLHDMHGNVWEWCLDWIDAYSEGEVTDPSGPREGMSRVSRGGSWSYKEKFSRSAARDALKPEYRNDDVGFRVTLVPAR